MNLKVNDLERSFLRKAVEITRGVGLDAAIKDSLLQKLHSGQDEKRERAENLLFAAFGECFRVGLVIDVGDESIENMRDYRRLIKVRNG